MTAAPAASVAAVREVLRAHNIECTSKATGEVSCRGCRDEGWMSYTKYHEHVAVAAADAAVQAATPGIQAGAKVEALREAAWKIGDLGAHKVPCRFPDAGCECGVLEMRAVANVHLRRLADRIETNR